MSCYQWHMFPFAQRQRSNHLMGLVVFYPYPCSTQQNTFPRSDPTCAQGICLHISRQINTGQQLRLASSNRLLKTAPHHDERESGFSSLKAESSLLQALHCSSRLIKWDAIDRVLRCSWTPVMSVDNFYLCYGKDIFNSALAFWLECSHTCINIHHFLQTSKSW